MPDRVLIYFLESVFGRTDKFRIAFRNIINYYNQILSRRSQNDLVPELYLYLRGLLKNDEKFLINTEEDLERTFQLSKQINKHTNKIFNYIFSDTEFIIHLGAHKTATTYIQHILKANKYDLAIKGIIIDLDEFREYCKSCNKDFSDFRKYILKSAGSCCSETQEGYYL